MPAKKLALQLMRSIVLRTQFSHIIGVWYSFAIAIVSVMWAGFAAGAAPKLNPFPK